MSFSHMPIGLALCTLHSAARLKAKFIHEGTSAEAWDQELHNSSSDYRHDSRAATTSALFMRSQRPQNEKDLQAAPKAVNPVLGKIKISWGKVNLFCVSGAVLLTLSA